MKTHEPGHRRRNKFVTARNFHVYVGIGDNRSSVRIDDLAVNARVMISLLLDDLERAGLSQMTITSAGDGRLHDNPAAANQIGTLLSEVDLNPVRIFILRERHSRER